MSVYTALRAARPRAWSAAPWAGAASAAAGASFTPSPSPLVPAPFAPPSSRAFTACAICQSGHNKWSKIKHKKQANDAARGQSYGTISREIIAAIKNYSSSLTPAGRESSSGAGSPEKATDPMFNTRLGVLIKKAKDMGFAKDKIEATIAKASGKGGDNAQNVTYEALGPTAENGSAVALVIESSTDSPARTHSKIRETFNKLGGRLSSTAHLFERAGVVRVICAVTPTVDAAAPSSAGASSAKVPTFDELFDFVLERGATDVRAVSSAEDLSEHELDTALSLASAQGDAAALPVVDVHCAPSDTRALADALRAEGYEVLDAEAKLLPVGPVYHARGEACGGAAAEGEAPAADATADNDAEPELDEASIAGWVDAEYVQRLDRMLTMLEENADVTRVWSNLAGWPAR